MDVLPVDRITGVQYYVQGSDENRLDSCVSVLNKDVFRNDLPTSGGIYDAHMGTTDYAWNCETCGNTKQTCPGHPGSLALKYPVKNPLFREQLLRWLKIICFTCGRIVTKKTVHASKSKMLIEYAKIRVDKCEWCGTPKLNVQRAKHEHNKFFMESSDVRGVSRTIEIFNHEIKQILDRVSNETVIKLGKSPISHPRKLILDTLRVPSNVIRPDIRRIGGSRSSNSDITAFLKTIVEINDSLPDEIPEVNRITPVLRDKYYTLDMTYFELVRGSSTTSNHVRTLTISNKAPGSLYERFRGKEGRIHKNLLGKRMRNMMRSVISGSDLLRIDEFSIPVINACDISIPETVRSYNRERLTMYFLNGKNIYPGCTGVLKKTSNSFHRIEQLAGNYTLQEGDIVYRNMITGDIINCNRQPTLEFCGVTAMRAVVAKNVKTHALNAAATKFFNADFDGDEMNAIIPQNIMARNEIELLASPESWFTTYKDGSPQLGCVHDAIIGMSEVTRHHVRFNKYHAMMMFSSIDLPTTELHFEDRIYTGRELVSMLLPNVNIKGVKPSMYMPQYAAALKYHLEDINVEISQGKLVTGVLDKNTIGNGRHGSLFHIINNEYGPKLSMAIIYAFQQLSSRYFMYSGYTTGLDDIILDKATMQTIKRNTEAIFIESRRITDRMHRGELVAPFGVSVRDFYEREQISALTPGDEFIVPVLADMNTDTNSLLKLVLTGSKGSIINLVQINVTLGSQLVANKLAARNFGWERTSPYFQRYETDPRSRGFVPTSFKEGIEPDVFPFAAAEARYGLLNIHLSTSVTGTINKLCVRNMESMISNNQRGVSNGSTAVQLLYVESGFDTRFLEKVIFPTVMIADNKFEEIYHSKASQFGFKDSPKIQSALDEEFKQLAADRNRYRKIFFRLEDSFVSSTLMGNQQLMPVNIQRIVDDIAYRAQCGTHKTNNHIDIDPIVCIAKVKKFISELKYIYFNTSQKIRHRELPAYYDQALGMLKILTRSYLCTAYLLKKHVTTTLLDVITLKIERVLARSLIDPGKAVGIIAAQCICEPMMQYLLDAKHRSGGGGSTKIDAVTRCKEIISVQSLADMKAPSMMIRLKPEDEKNHLKAKEIANHIEVMYLNKFIISTHIFFERYGEILHPKFKHETEMIKIFEKLNRGLQPPGDLTRWCIRFEFDREKLIFNGMRMDTIILALRRRAPHLYLVYTPETAERLIVRCYPRFSAFKNAAVEEADVIRLMRTVRTIVVRGLQEITSASVTTVAKSYVTADGSIATDKVYMIDTNGANLEAILSNKYIDAYRTQTDSITEFEKIFGIAAARDKIIYEMIKALSNLSRNLCTLLADEMTFTGTITSIQMTGMNAREPRNISLRMALQSPLQIAESAAIDNISENMKGITGPWLMGSVPRIGTLYNTVTISNNFIQKERADLESRLEELL